MAPQTEKILQQHEVELTRLQGTVVMDERELAQLRPLVAEVVASRAQIVTRAEDTAKLRAAETEIALLKHQIADLAKVKESWGHRAWFIVTITLSAFFATLTAILGALLTFTLNAKK